ncbi:peptidylprolyl isomerase [Christensenellaceae bacterium NSJ-44]|uniref:Peptidyl-prolyl cis-trans isomerase n=1 Tax=Luoshenia tenuis TaxID=2763654 RepID=A0A926HI72_9FIRM|nr:peptidylprolyl isomerase [Luoshenia tenuis]MBC8528482.1 peptidylprolyl isomerase [Luoshenia tenuis]
MKKLVALLICLALFAPGCASEEPVQATSGVTATIQMEDGGNIVLELYPDKAPQSVRNFVYLAREGFYDGLTFHRIIKDFMIQGGDPLGNGTGGPGYCIKGEFKENGVQNDISHVRGVISFARNNVSMDSAGSQFFIVHKDSTYLDGKYAAFGKVISGMDVVDKIAETDGKGDAPVIKTVTIEGPELPEPDKLEEQ